MKALDQLFINFRDFGFDGHAYRWVDIKRFGLSRPVAADEDLLKDLIGHEHYRDDYAGGGVEAGGERHGPYWLRNVGPDAFAAISETEASAVLRDWANRFGALPDPLAARLEREVHPLVRGATVRYRLQDLGVEAFHDWGGVHGEFHELVLLDRQAATLSLLVAADD
ncbi:TilS substrate-binding domain-containing protein [Herbidospora sp. RD11066]